MYYELYVDVLFLVNFMMDFLLLLLVKKMLKCTATYGSVCLGAALGALLTCVIIIVPISNIFLKFILFHMIVNTFMIRVGLKIKNIRSIAKAYILLYVGGFLLGGVLEAFYQYVRVGSFFFAIVIGGYYFVSKLWDVLSMILKVNQYQCNVILFYGEKQCQIKGIIDTGNGLRDPISNQPVSVLGKGIAKKFLGNETVEQIRYISYHSIGKKVGVMPVIKIDQMCVCNEKEWWITEPLIGLSEEEISANGEYQMILNPNLF